MANHSGQTKQYACSTLMTHSARVRYRCSVALPLVPEKTCRALTPGLVMQHHTSLYIYSTFESQPVCLNKRATTLEANRSDLRLFFESSVGVIEHNSVEPITPRQIHKGYITALKVNIVYQNTPSIGRSGFITSLQKEKPTIKAHT